jgi:hypothetical protein
MPDPGTTGKPANEAGASHAFGMPVDAQARLAAEIRLLKSQIAELRAAVSAAVAPPTPQAKPVPVGDRLSSLALDRPWLGATVLSLTGWIFFIRTIGSVRSRFTRQRAREHGCSTRQK